MLPREKVFQFHAEEGGETREARQALPRRLRAQVDIARGDFPVCDHDVPLLGVIGGDEEEGVTIDRSDRSSGLCLVDTVVPESGSFNLFTRGA